MAKKASIGICRPAWTARDIETLVHGRWWYGRQRPSPGQKQESDDQKGKAKKEESEIMSEARDASANSTSWRPKKSWEPAGAGGLKQAQNRDYLNSC